MKSHRLAQAALRLRLKHLVADLFRPDLGEPSQIADDEPLIGGRLGLDSLDAIELSLCLEEEFGVALSSGGEIHRALASIGGLANFIPLRGLNPRNEPGRVTPHNAVFGLRLPSRS